MHSSFFPYIELLPKPGQARGVQIELDPMRVGLRYPVEIGLVGDSRRTLDALLPLLRGTTDGRFLEKTQKGMTRWRELIGRRAHGRTRR